MGKTLYHQGDLSYFEAVNKETLRNAWTRYDEEGILQIVKPRDSKSSPRARLAPEWTPSRDPDTGLLLSEGRLWDFIEAIAQSRREGKNRRDGATVSTRVLRLTETIGRKLFAPGAGLETMLSSDDKKLLQKRLQKRKAIPRSVHL